MSATTQSATAGGESSQRRRLRSGLVSAAVLSILVAGLVLAIPGLGSVVHRLAHAHWGWVVVAGGLELASCVGYVLAFQAIFGDVPGRFAAMIAAAEQAFGAVVPIGGAGGIAAGGWLLSRAGMPVRVVAERSAVLFLLTSATNVVTLVLAGAGLAIGLFAGPRNLALGALPAFVGAAVLLPFLILARRASRTDGAGRSPRSRALRAAAGTCAVTLRMIQRPGWRLSVGAVAYLLCDMAVLWLAIHALGYDVPAAPLVLAYLIGYLANTIPVPGGVGVLDGGLAGALLLYHAPAQVALGGVLLYHALALWIPALSGMAGFVAAQREIASGSARVSANRAPTGSDTLPSGSDRGRAASATHDTRRRSLSAAPQAGRPCLSKAS